MKEYCKKCIKEKYVFISSAIHGGSRGMCNPNDPSSIGVC